MSWPEGFSITKTHTETVKNPDGSIEGNVKVLGGPFYFNRSLFTYSKNGKKYRVECYLGMRPTSPWSPGYGNEGDFGSGWFGRFMKKIGAGNFGAALRRKEISNG